LAKKLISLGFTDVNLSTGFDQKDLPIIPGLRSVIGKKYPLKYSENSS